MADRQPVRALIAELADRVGIEAFVSVCVDLLGGAPREDHVEALRGLTGHAWLPGDDVVDAASWADHWVRSWGARGLLHVWHDAATPAIVAGLGDAHYRPAEMCLKVAARHEVAGSADGAVRLAGHELARVRAQAMRALAVVGDTEHIEVVLDRLRDEHLDVRRQAERARQALARRLDLDDGLDPHHPGRR
ncbi:HEAT repeat domain-containing protein [Nocardioides sp. R-C-SC26]|uniref:HEAT repeat domain-containing protein n=1 Tax=Nocardioides sp. R-C-SC26 TaxID=2870414 RepID=UPI001E36652E|nr:HEAT repeat domain-containing protein [Nocardioides sp. R-C-SC26]